MTNEQINKTIATHIFGYEDYDMLYNINNPTNVHRERKLYGAKKNDDYWTLVPDYCIDLNAMHEAMKTLSEEQVEKVWETLCDMIPINPHSFRNGLVFDVSARVRAEAFLRVIGEWKE